MAKRKKKQGIVNPTRLASFDKEKKVQVVIETPKGSRNKYAWDPKQQIFALKKSFRKAWHSRTTSASSLQLKVRWRSH